MRWFIVEIDSVFTFVMCHDEDDQHERFAADTFRELSEAEMDAIAGEHKERISNQYLTITGTTLANCVVTYNPPPTDYHEWDGSAWQWDDTSHKEAVMTQLRKNVDEVSDQITAEYAQGERDTWQAQIEDAKAYDANNSIADSEIPFLVASVAARNANKPSGDADETKATLAAKIINNHNEYKTASGNVIGQRRGKEAQIEAATTHTEVDAVDITITFPSLSVQDK